MCLFKELKERKKHLPSHCFGKENKNTKKIVLLVMGGVPVVCRFSLFAGGVF